MASHHDELIAAALLLQRKEGERGRIARARVRRSLSTLYYGLFHFLVDEIAVLTVGSGHNLQVRRRTLVRVLTHQGVLRALSKVRGQEPHDSVRQFFEPHTACPPFIRRMAALFADAQTKREAADYDLNQPVSEDDAAELATRVTQGVAAWRGANTRSDRDFKHAVALLCLLKGQLRREG